MLLAKLLNRAQRHAEARDLAGALVRELRERPKRGNDEHGMLPSIQRVYARSAAAAAKMGGGI